MGTVGYLFKFPSWSGGAGRWALEAVAIFYLASPLLML